MNKHTPAPWDYWSGYNSHDRIEAQITAEAGDIVIADYNHLIEQGEANAKLIAAAPDLLSVAQRLVQWDIDYPVNCYDGYAGLKALNEIIADAKNQIARARGEA